MTAKTQLALKSYAHSRDLKDLAQRSSFQRHPSMLSVRSENTTDVSVSITPRGEGGELESAGGASRAPPRLASPSPL